MNPKDQSSFVVFYCSLSLARERLRHPELAVKWNSKVVLGEKIKLGCLRSASTEKRRSAETGVRIAETQGRIRTQQRGSDRSFNLRKIATVNTAHGKHSSSVQRLAFEKSAKS
ncbi:hypothetical protein NE237_032172 [Protea cynaroides]|uniref:Uncharacterized protein n=1 Tax=Protea cynaroides TaxID=273540 RepID=A0A9Q0L2X1_9MAGN|nr:hypothetical protein NE237_032172 [Protea cynaroides]